MLQFSFLYSEVVLSNDPVVEFVIILRIESRINNRVDLLNSHYISVCFINNLKFHYRMKLVSAGLMGVDEAGRGPLAGPVSVGACAVPVQFTRKHFKGIKDSKKLSEKQREEWFSRMNYLAPQPPNLVPWVPSKVFPKGVKYAVTLVSNKIIDTKGLSYAIRFALQSSLKKLKLNPAECMVLLDGGLKAPIEYKNQKTIIKGDEKEYAISLASIAAKVTRDRLMVRLSKKYRAYGFEVHKGYGTKRHIENIKKYGLSPLHRRSFLTNLL